MEYLLSNIKLFVILFIVSVFCTVMFTEIVKKLDKNDNYLVFVEGSMFGFSVFGYEVILKSITRIFNKIINKVENKIENIVDKEEN